MSRGKLSNIVELAIIAMIVLVAHVATSRAQGDAQGTFQGSVTSSNGPVVGAAVKIRGSKDEWQGSTDSQGRFTSKAMIAGQYKIMVSAAGFAGSSQVVQLNGGATAVAFKLVPLASAVPAKLPVVGVKPEPAKEYRQKAYDGNMPAPPMSLPASQSLAGSRRSMPAPPISIRQPMIADPASNTEDYSHIADNSFVPVASAPLSTFSADVDTASYANVRRYLRDGSMPPKDAVRIEELMNYFRYNDATPTGKDPFAVSTELAVSPWHAQYQLLRIGLRAPAIADAQVPARNLVFLLDVSGSMNDARKLPLLKQAMNLLVEQMRPQDRIAITVYAGASGVALPSTTGDRKDVIRNAVALLEAGGSTNGAAGIQLAYELAQKHFIKGGINRVILATDGDFNVGPSSEGELVRMIEAKREHGVFLTVLGFGMGNIKDGKLEKLADHGNGNYAYIDTIEEARKVLVKEAGATLVTVAKDVKLQVEFNPATVAGYRLVGYENRMLRDQDFNDDKKDAGDIGAGHTVTALYEIIPAGVAVPGAKVDALKYQTAGATKTVGAGAGQELLTVKLRYKRSTDTASQLMSRVVTTGVMPFANASENLRWSAAVASFGMLLRGSPHVGSVGWNDVTRIASAAKGKDAEGYRREFLLMVARAIQLNGGKTQLAK
ncbi:MAG: von Willebrand factor type A domain-containing protein [Kofleriaceae bacterium]|nr:von Willebrand factor type A domain-containing protein [Kofleriaceae bacterium]